MSNDGHVTIEKSKLTALRREAPDKARNLVDALAFDGLAFVQRSFGTSVSAPGDFPGVVSGALRAEVHVENTGDMERAIVSSMEYSAPLEFGTVNMQARPYMMPTAYYIRGQVPIMWSHFIE